MVKYSSDQLDLIFRALSDSTRRAMLAKLTRSELNVSELAAPFDMSLAAVSKHIKVLENAQLVEKTKEGRNFRCRAQVEPLAAVTKLLEELGAYWRAQLGSLENYLSNEKNVKGEKKWDKPSKTRQK